MDKKDIYEHLAKIYLDASVKGEAQEYKRLINFVLAIIFAIAVVFIFLFIAPYKNVNHNYKSLLLESKLLKLNPGLKQTQNASWALHLDRLNLNHFRTLQFSARSDDPLSSLTLRIKFMSATKEKSEVYLKNIAGKWKDYTLPLSDFKNISNWSQMLNLSFITEKPNNSGAKKTTVYIDNIRLLR